VTRKYGWKRPTKPSAHPLARIARLVDQPLPSVVDMRPLDTPIADQGDKGECTGETCAGLAQFILKRTSRFFPVSSLAIYYWERAGEGDPGVDNGANLSDGFTVMSTTGIPPASVWPDIDADLLKSPALAVAQAAAAHKLTDPVAIPQDLRAIRSQLADAYPVAVGIEVYRQFESDHAANTGIITMPRLWNMSIGGHAILVVGYNDHTQEFMFRNSWGATWGDKGYGYLPYDYLVDPRLCSDLHSGRTIS
jgi:Papain family cysteine protease